MARERGDDTRGRLPDRGLKVPKGPSFAMTTAAAAGVAAAILAFLGAFLVGAAGASDPGQAMDAAGVQAARMLAAPGIERWRRGFGSTEQARSKALAWLSDEAAKRDKAATEAAVNAFRQGKPGLGREWAPGLDMIFPPNDPADTLLDQARKDALDRVVKGAPGALIGAGVKELSGTYLVAISNSQTVATNTPPTAQLGETKVFAYTDKRQYEHPVRNREGSIEGTAVVTLASSAQAGSPIGAAGAAAGFAFLGAFIAAFVVALGPVKAIRRLAIETEALASGDPNARVIVAGPDVVQAAARNVQKLAQYAANAAAAVPAEPQVVEQQVYVQPVAEIQEGLAPTKSFQRPDEFEIEATQKAAPDLGNDYYDVVNVDADRVGIFIADIPNLRGVRGAMYMSQVRAIFRSFAPGEQSPAETLKAVNRGFAADLPRGIYVTAMYAVVDRRTGACRIASAQHLPLVFWKLAKKASAKVAPEGIALGLDAGGVFDKTLAEKTIQLERGDRIVLFTDGAINARNSAGAQYGEERFYYVVNREAPKNSAACVNFVANDVDLFHEGAQQIDDFTIVTLRMMR